jgi:hypothetical protein
MVWNYVSSYIPKSLDWHAIQEKQFTSNTKQERSVCIKGGKRKSK